MSEGDAPVLDSFGRAPREDAPAESPAPPPPPRIPPAVEIVPDFELRPQRRRVDGRPELDVTWENPESQAEAKKIAKKIVHICSPKVRYDTGQIESLADEIWKQFSTRSELFKVLFESVLRMSPQIEALAAMIGKYGMKFDHSPVTHLICEDVADALRSSFAADDFRTVKLLLRFLGACALFEVVTMESYVRLLSSLSKTLELCSKFRGEGIARALLVAVKMAPSTFPADAKEEILAAVKKYVDERGEEFAVPFSPFGKRETFVDVLLRCEDWQDLSSDYVGLFEGSDEHLRIEIPEIEFEFGATDVAPFPFVLLTNLNPEKWGSINPLIADIADDILVYFGSDGDLVTDQVMGLPMLLHFPSLKVNADPGALYVLDIFVTVLFSDLFRLPAPYFCPAFQVSVLTALVRKAEISSNVKVQDHMGPVIVAISDQMDDLDPGCVHRMVRFFAHQISNLSFSFCWGDWQPFVELEDDNPRKIFLKSVLRQCMLLGNPQLVKTAARGMFDEIMPPDPDVNYTHGEGTEFATQAAELLEKVRKEPEAVPDMVREMKGSVLGEFTTANLLLSVLFLEGQGEADRTIVEISKFGDLFKEIFDVAWKRELLITIAADFYVNLSPVFEELMTYFILNEYCSYEEFVKYFFDRESMVAAKPDNWKLFHAVVNSLMKSNLTQGKVVAAQDIMKQIFETAAQFFEAVNMSAIGEKWFIGNMIEFGKQYYDVFASVSTHMNGLIVSGTAKKGLEKIIKTINSFNPE